MKIKKNEILQDFKGAICRNWPVRAKKNRGQHISNHEQ